MPVSLAQTYLSVYGLEEAMANAFADTYDTAGGDSVLAPVDETMETVEQQQTAVEDALIDLSSTRSHQGTGRIDDYHAADNRTIVYRTQYDKKWRYVRFSYHVALHNHSANVNMDWRELGGRGLIVSWKLRTRHDRNNGRDSTIFTYPSVYGNASYSATGSEYEDRYGDGYDRLPYESNWKVFFDAYDVGLRYAGVYMPVHGTLQTSRLTCFKTVPCKFKKK